MPNMSNEETLPLEDERTDSVPRITPDYADDGMRELGERLAELYLQRETQPDATLADEIIRVRYRMRKGPRLWAGEFLQDGRYRLIARSQDNSADGYWTAWDRVTTDLVTVRVFHSQWVTDPAAVRAFTSRGDALKRLAHPGIGAVLDAARSEEGFVYLATSHLDAGSLADTPLDTTDAIQAAIEAAAALRHAHEQGVVHGDLRPGNVMLTADGSIRVVGFSIEPTLRSEGNSLYRAPETTEAGYVPQPAADVYALGMTTLAALNGGDLPFWVLRDPGRLIRSLSISESTRSVLSRATDWDLSVRYPTMEALIEDWLSDPELVAALALRARQRERAAVAAGHYEALLELQPSRSVEIRTILGEVYAAMGAHSRALDHLLAALERTSDVEALFVPLRAAAGQTGSWSRLAEALWAQARVRDAGRRVVLRMELARINHEHLDNAVAAAETWSQVLTDHRTPEQAITALRNLCDLARHRQDWVGYTEFAQELLDYLPKSERAPIEFAIGRAYLEHLNDEPSALEFIDRAEAAGYTEVDLAPRMQGIRGRRGQWKRVIQLMVEQAAIQDLGEASPTLLRAGIIASAVHLEEEAFTVYHALLKRAPRHVVALRHVARLHHRAHEHDEAVHYYERLWETYKGRESEEPEASERAADCAAYASLLVKTGRPDEAVERLALALKLNPNHVPSLQLAGPLYLSRGEVGQAGVVFDRMLALFKSVELSSYKIDACLGMGEIAWVQGRITAAMGWYNRALELDPFSALGWWGLAKVGLAASGGHPGADRAPWVKAVPKRYTGLEALARLFAGLLDPWAVRQWLALAPLGQAMLDGGETGMRVACAAVDLMARSELIDPNLFQRLSDAYPDWHDEIEQVRNLWLSGAAATFPVSRSQGWSKRLLDGDFDVSSTRTVLPPDLLMTTFDNASLRSADAWKVLLGGQPPKAPSAYEPPQAAQSRQTARHAGPIGALVRDGKLMLAFDRGQTSARIGGEEESELRIVDDPGIGRRHARLFRQGSRVYIESIDGGRVLVDGEARSVWRLLGGERVTLGDTRLQYQVFDDLSHLPPPPEGRAEDLLPRKRTPGRAARAPSVPPPRPPLAEPARATPVPAPAPEPIANAESVRLLEPTAALSIEGLRELAEIGDEDDEPELTVALATVAEAVAGGSELTVALPDSTESDLPDSEGPDDVLAAIAEVVAEHTDPGARSDTTDGSEGDSAVSEDEEVIWARNGHVPASVRSSPEPDPEVTQKLIHVMDDGSIATSPIPDDVLQAALGMVPPEEEDDEDDEDDEGDDESAPADDTTTLMPIGSAPDAVPTLIESARRVETPPPPPGGGVFGFPSDMAEADIDHLTSPPKLGRGVSSRTPSSPGSATPVGPTAVPLERSEAPKGLPASLEFMSGPDRGRRVEIGEALRVGQSQQCELSIPGDGRLSPIHCRVTRTPEGFLLTDEGSVNGTVVNGQRVTRFSLHGGEVIMVGRTVLRFWLEKAT